MSIPPKTTAGEAIASDGDLHGLLVVLGYQPRERVSINTQLPGGPFVSELKRVSDLAGWSPPQDRNVWFGVNPVARQVRYGRGTEADITRVRVLFADLDVKPGKQFDTIAQCHRAVDVLNLLLGVSPVAVVESGHGAQPYWRVASPPGDSNVVDLDRSRDEWKTIYQRWGGLVQQAAREAMWSPDGSQKARGIDNVFELARVLRCPGSINWKNPDDPVPVRTRLGDRRGQVRAAELVAGLDRDNVGPLATVRPMAAKLPTSFGEADAWIHEQPGATLELAELQQLPRGRVLGDYLDPVALVSVLAYGDGGADRTMIKKVLHAVLSAQEGRAGLVVALNNIAEAYLEVMEARARGELTVGEARSAATAAGEFHRALIGAVAQARARRVPVLPRVDESGAVLWRGPDDLNTVPASVSGGIEVLRPRVYAPVYRRYRR
jgi:hypothetical protein